MLKYSSSYNHSYFYIFYINVWMFVNTAILYEPKYFNDYSENHNNKNKQTDRQTLEKMLYAASIFFQFHTLNFARVLR